MLPSFKLISKNNLEIVCCGKIYNSKNEIFLKPSTANYLQILQYHIPFLKKFYEPFG